MVDNTNQTGSDTIATDDIGSGVASGAKVQRVKNGWGADGTYVDVDATNPLPVLADARGTTLASVSNNFAAAATGNTTVLDVSRQGNVTFVIKNQTAGSPFGAGLIVVFEQSDDNTSWYPLMVVRNDNQFAASTHRFEANSANTGFVLEAAAEAVSYVRARVTTGPATNGATIVTSAGSLAFNPIITAAPLLSFVSGSNAGNINVVRVTGTATAANTTQLVAAPGAGLSLYVTDISVGNSGSTLTVVTLGAGSGFTPTYDIPAAASGGGATINLKYAWKLAANTGLYYAVSAATTSWYLTVNYYVGV